MPTYEYSCNACGYIFETFHSISMPPLVDCPECSKSTLIRLIGGGAAIIIKGTTTPCREESISKRQKLGSTKTEIPFWRTDETGKVRKDILKNPEKYIITGET